VKATQCHPTARRSPAQLGHRPPVLPDLLLGVFLGLLGAGVMRGAQALEVVRIPEAARIPLMRDNVVRDGRLDKTRQTVPAPWLLKELGRPDRLPAAGVVPWVTQESPSIHTATWARADPSPEISQATVTTA
jgi:hypothetical protein